MSDGVPGLTWVWHRVLVLIANISVGASRWPRGWCCRARVCAAKNKDLLSLRATLQHPHHARRLRLGTGAFRVIMRCAFGSSALISQTTVNPLTLSRSVAGTLSMSFAMIVLFSGGRCCRGEVWSELAAAYVRGCHIGKSAARRS